MTGGIENRRHLRLSAMGPVEVVVQGGAPQVAYLASIGRGGLGLYLHQEVRPGQLLLVSLHLLAAQGDPEDLKVVARVRWAGRSRRCGWRGSPSSRCPTPGTRACCSI